MLDAQLILRLCAFLCFMTGIFSPGIVIKWGLSSSIVRRRTLTAFSGLIVLFILVNQPDMSEPKAYLENETAESKQVFLFSSLEDEEETKVYKVADTGYTQHLSIEVIDEQTTKGNDVYQAPEGYQFVQVTYQITNQLEDPYTLDMNELQLQTETSEMLSPQLVDETSTRLIIDSKKSEELSLIYLQPIDEAYLTVTYLPLHYEMGSEDEETEDLVVSKIGEVLKTKQAMIQVHDVNRMPQKEKVGYEYIEVSLSIKNPTNQLITYYPFHFELGCSLSPSNTKPMIGVTEANTLTITELAGGGLVSGTLLFEVPKGASELTLFYNEPGLFTKQRYEINLMETTPQPLPLQSEVTLEEHEQNLTQENGMNLEILNTEFTTKTQYSQASSHRQFILVEVKLSNISADIKEYTTYDFKLMNDQGRLLLPSLFLVDNEHELKNGALHPNEEVSGYVLFEASDLHEEFTLVYSPNHWETSNYLIHKISEN